QTVYPSKGESAGPLLGPLCSSESSEAPLRWSGQFGATPPFLDADRQPSGDRLLQEGDQCLAVLRRLGQVGTHPAQLRHRIVEGLCDERQLGDRQRAISTDPALLVPRQQERHLPEVWVSWVVGIKLPSVDGPHAVHEVREVAGPHQ